MPRKHEISAFVNKYHHYTKYCVFMYLYPYSIWSRNFFFFLKFLVDTCPFLGPLVPLFWISGDVSSGFQSQSGFCLICYFCGGECNVHSPRLTSGATLTDLLVAGAQPVTSPHTCAEVGLGSHSNVQPHEQKTNALPLCQWPGLWSRNFI